jgi:hypothetical protein
MSGIIESIISMAKIELNNIAVEPKDNSEKAFLEAKIKTGENLLKHLEEKGETENCEILETYLKAAKLLVKENDNED